MGQLQHLFYKFQNAHKISDLEGSIKDIIEKTGFKGAHTFASGLSLWVAV